jgi:hypothetical protein
MDMTRQKNATKTQKPIFALLGLLVRLSTNAQKSATALVSIAVQPTKQLNLDKTSIR